MQPFSIFYELLSLYLLLSLSLFACRLLKPVPKMTVKGGTSQACAACKYQRRRCSSECALSPFFPANEPKMFQNAHRLFGVCNIMKILKQLTDDIQKKEAMKSIIYESNIREMFPVYGCWGIICHYHHQIRQALEELQYVQARLAIFREQCHDQMGIGSNNLVPFGVNQHVMNENNGVYFEAFEEMGKPSWGQQYVHVNQMMNNCHLGDSQGLPIQQEREVCQDYDFMPYDTIADDRQSYIESKEACDSSSESSMKDITQSIEQYVSTNELRSAAACFSLTNVN